MCREKPTRYTGCEYDASGSLTEKKNPLSLYADAVFGYSPELTRTVPSSIGYGTDYCAVFDGNGNEMPASAYTKEYANRFYEVKQGTFPPPAARR